MSALHSTTPFDPRRPFTRADAVAAGVPTGILRSSRFRRLFRDVYVDAAVEDTIPLHVEGALLIHPPDAFASHTSAAAVYGLPVPSTSVHHVSVWRQQDRRSRPGLRPHVAPAGSQVRRSRGLRVSVPEQMFVELAGVLDLVDLVVVGDAVVNMFGISPGELVRHCDATSVRHAVAARVAARYVRAGVESPMETRLRMLIVLAGLPEPVVNATVTVDGGRARVRLDLSYPRLKIAIEYDGRQHAASADQWQRDLLRREHLDNDGWRLLVVTAHGIYRAPHDTLRRLAELLGERGMPVRVRDDWRPHFRAH